MVLYLIAKKMNESTGLEIVPENIHLISAKESKVQIYAYQAGLNTILCWKYISGNYIIKNIAW